VAPAPSRRCSSVQRSGSVAGGGVLFLNTETDVTFLGAGFSVHNQPDSNTFRMAEAASVPQGAAGNAEIIPDP
jgi:hypothetical protein